MYRAEEITKRICNNIMNSLKVQYKMDTRFMSSENSKISEPLRLLLNLEDELNLKIEEEYVPLSNLSMYYTWKI